QRVEVPRDPGVDLERLVVDEAHLDVPLRRHGRHEELERLLAVLLREAGLVPLIALLLVHRAGAFARDDLALEERLAGDDRHLGERGALRQRERVPALHRRGGRVVEGLVHLRSGEAVAQEDVDVVGADPERLLRTPDRRERPRRARGRTRREGQRREREDREEEGGTAWTHWMDSGFGRAGWRTEAPRRK